VDGLADRERAGNEIARMRVVVEVDDSNEAAVGKGGKLRVVEIRSPSPSI
jgi:hypothetical protein